MCFYPSPSISEWAEG